MLKRKHRKAQNLVPIKVPLKKELENGKIITCKKKVY